MSFNYQEVSREALVKAGFWTVVRLLGNNDILPQRGRIIDTALQIGIFFTGKSLVQRFVEPLPEFKNLDAKTRKVARYALSYAFTLVTVLALYNLIGQKICEQRFARNCIIYTVAACIFDYFRPNLARELL